MERLIKYQFVGELGGVGAAASGASRRREKACFWRPLARKTPPADAGGPSRKETPELPNLHSKAILSQPALPAVEVT